MNSAFLSLLVLSLLASAAGARADDRLDLSRSGVVCDRKEKICYDRNGASASETRRKYGWNAERDLLRLLSGRPRRIEIIFSSGELCDLRTQSCWDDGSRRSNVSRRLNRHLFGREQGGSGWGGDGWQTPATGGGWASCELSQRGRRVFSGNCSLRRRNAADGSEYEVDFRNGRRYTFVNRRGQLVLRDATGTWAVRQSGSGGRARFLWSDLELEIDRRAGGGRFPTATPYPGRNPLGPAYGPPYGPPTGPSSTPLQLLIESLFR